MQQTGSAARRDGRNLLTANAFGVKKLIYLSLTPTVSILYVCITQVHILQKTVLKHT